MHAAVRPPNVCCVGERRPLRCARRAVAVASGSGSGRGVIERVKQADTASLKGSNKRTRRRTTRRAAGKP
eukprot:352375-Chlamydomonas_euryale.AAC.6